MSWHVLAIMGVHTLWNILEETGVEIITVRDLRGKKLAVDLSSWIVELQQSKVSTQFRNAYIRNLFFRTTDFMKEGVELVFVTDGRAPELKQQATANTGRHYLRNAASWCVEMLGYLGLPCVQAAEEAEAMCAYLNSQQLVDGCLTDDNDFFLYGGKTLYRKLSKHNKMYVIEKFDMDKINADLRLERRDLVALALLLGSDYDEKGVKYVGKEKGKALVELLKSRKLDVLDRLLGWKNNQELDSIEEQLSAETKQSHCRKCGHLGRVSAHEASGCSVCGIDSGCQESSKVTCQCAWHKQEALKKQHKLELSLRQKSLQNESFPNEKVIQEYLNPHLQSCKEITKPSMNVPKLMAFMKSHFGWTSDKALEKLVPIVILNELREKGSQSDLMFTPIRILRSCKESHVDCYEVTWDKTDKNDWAGTNFSTNIQKKIEKGLFSTVYPAMVSQYEKSQMQRKSASGKKRKPEVDKGQLKLTQYKKIKKKLPFNEEESGRTQKTDFVDIYDIKNVSSTSTDTANKTTADHSEDADEKVDTTSHDIVSGSKLDTRYNVEPETSCSIPIGSPSGQNRKSHGNAKLQKSKMGKKGGSGKRTVDKKSTTDLSQASIKNFFARREIKSDTKAMEFKQNDTTAFKTLNNSTG
ncbi:flap endonuclease GEN homolog 1-like isoform X2 [Mercenaria mercenaria]|uniref:flap endonuclease GEN homolog 1-like isoform X2 n=1 Tax=Mercenaria mercenaria TaxID=6596 RepID=UPI00234EAF3A|nr:flap endonuclease GEN homolog 1-like isoform X2 [Mercenaria mercenaria]